MSKDNQPVPSWTELTPDKVDELKNIEPYRIVLARFDKVETVKSTTWHPNCTFSLDGVIGYSGKELADLQKLLICRDAYWKFAGNWSPDWQDSNLKYCIKSIGADVVKGSDATICCILAFQTEELRDAFWNNFKDLIMECKELL